MLEQYHRINDAVGVSITVGTDGDVLIHACSVQVNSNQLTIEKKRINLQSVSQLAKLFPAKSLIALNLSGKGILQKQIEKVEQINPDNFGKILPNAEPGHFYVQNFISGNQSFISVIRKTEADKWISQLKGLGYIPLMLSLGPFPVQNIVSQLNSYEGDFAFNGYEIKRDEHKNWTSVTYNESFSSPFPLKIETETIDEKLLIPYAAAFQLVLTDKVDPVKAEVPDLDNGLNKLISEKKLYVKGFIVLAVFFVLLLANFFLFSALNSANAQLSGQVSRSAQSTTDVQNINDQIKEKEGLLKILGWDGGIRKSILVDQIASVLPPEVSWKEVAINPVDLSSSRIQKTLIFFNRRIRVAGTSQKIIPINEWIARVKSKAWVKNIQLESYTYNNELNTGQFIILIDY
jgi:Tfp pilus assembly protein PilN